MTKQQLLDRGYDSSIVEDMLKLETFNVDITMMDKETSHSDIVKMYECAELLQSYAEFEIIENYKYFEICYIIYSKDVTILKRALDNKNINEDVLLMIEAFGTEYMNYQGRKSIPTLEFKI